MARRPTRTGAALGALVTCLTAAALTVPAGAGAGAAMHQCAHKPHVPGVSWVYLNERGLGCDHARSLATHTLRHGAPQHYECTHKLGPPAGRFVQWHCHHKDNHHGAPVRAFAFGYTVQ